MEKEVQCPWCAHSVVPEVRIFRNDHGDIKERRCPECKKVLSAYLDEKRPVLNKVRAFKG